MTARAPGGVRHPWPVPNAPVDAAGTATAVRELGAGADIVLLHGPGEHAAVWSDTAELLAANHHVVVPDLPGHGDTAPVDELDVERVIHWLDDVIAGTCEAAPIVVGRTLGGAIAARYCAARPGSASRLVLVDTLGLVPFDPAPPFGAALQRFMAEPSVATHARLMEYCAYDFDAMRRRLGERWSPMAEYTVDRVRDAERLASIGALMALFGMPAIPHDVLAGITTPTILIWGRHDLATPLTVAQSASRERGWPLYVVDDAGDDPALEQPDAFVDALRRALGQGMAAGGSTT